MPTPTPKQKHAGEICVSTWLPANLVTDLDAFLSAQAAGALGVKPSRQKFMLHVLREALDRAKPTQEVRP